MWTKADREHIHAISGAVYLLAGFLFLLAVAVDDIAKLGLHNISAGGAQPPLISFALLSLLFGALNAGSGLQPALVSSSLTDLLKAVVVGQNRNLKSAGFANL